jgi:hypothetical protein
MYIDSIEKTGFFSLSRLCDVIHPQKPGFADSTFHAQQAPSITQPGKLLNAAANRSGKIYRKCVDSPAALCNAKGRRYALASN